MNSRKKTISDHFDKERYCMITPGNVYELTQPQKRIWVTQMIHPQSPMFNIGGTVTIYGDVCVDTLKKAIMLFINSHDAFRIRLLHCEGEPKQFFDEHTTINIPFVDFLGMHNAQAVFDNWVKNNAKSIIPLYEQSLYKFWVYRIDDHVYGYMSKFHHIMADGWSMQLMTQGISEYYANLIENAADATQSLKTSYKDYINAEREYLTSARYQKDRDFWHKLIRDPSVDYNVQGEALLDGNRFSAQLTTYETQAVQSFCSMYHVSENSFFVGLYLLFIYKTTGQRDVVIGNPVLGRMGKKDRQIFGMFVGSMPFFYHVDPDMGIVEMFRHVHGMIRQCFVHQRYPYNYFVKDMGLSSTQSLYTSCINYYNTAMCREFHGYCVENKEFYNGQQDYDLQIIVREWMNTNQIQIDIDYKTKLYNEADITNMMRLLIHMLRETTAAGHLKVCDLHLLGKAENDALVHHFNYTGSDWPQGKSVVDLWEEQVALTPESIAVTDEGVSITYAALRDRSITLAEKLLRMGVTNNAVVGLYVSHSIGAIVGILGILTAGGAYLPVEKTSPANRINYLLSDASVDLLVSDSDFPDAVGFAGHVVRIDDEMYTSKGADLNTVLRNDCESDLRKNRPRPGDLAYVLYTSGSTGAPKGVLIEHHSLLNYLFWAKSQYVTQEKEIFPLYSSLAFDLTVTSIFTPLISGNIICIYRKDNEDEHVLFRILRENKSTVLKLTPAHLRLLSERNYEQSTIRKLIVGGENLTTALARAVSDSFSGHVTIYNEYGPTEAAVGCMIHRYNEQTDTAGSVPIGKPISNSQIYILDRDMNPVPVGIHGELYIGGQGVSRGYINQPALTGEKFLTDHRFDTTLYRSGDIAAFQDNGTIIYKGRADQQLKINGYRIEPGEIEAAIKVFPGIQNAVVTQTGSMTGKRLCTYYVCDDEMDEGALKQYLGTVLPNYMIPVEYVRIDAMPLSQNGKLDYRQLPDPVSIPLNRQFFLRTNAMEVLIEAISSVMKFEVEPEHHFFHIGGDSIKAIQISSKLCEMGYYLKVREILEHPIIHEMSDYMVRNPGALLTDVDSEGDMPPTPMINWFLLHPPDSRNSYCQIAHILLKCDCGIELLTDILTQLIRYHDALRLYYSESEHRMQFAAPANCTMPAIEEYTLVCATADEAEERVNTYARQLIHSMDLAAAPIIRSYLLHINDGTIWLIAIHHVAIDAVSWQILLSDIHCMMKQGCNKVPLALPEKTASYKQWALALQSQAERQAEEFPFWESMGRYVSIPGSGLNKSPSIAFLTESLDSTFTEQIRFDANSSYNTTTDELLLAAFILAAGRVMALQSIVVEMERHGRLATMEDMDLSRTMGWFTTMFPLVLDIHLDNLQRHIMQTKETVRNVPFQGAGYSLCELKNRWQREQEWFRFNYLGELEEGNELFSVDLSSGIMHTLSSLLTCQAEVVCYIKQGKLCMIIKYPGDETNARILQSVMRQWVHEIRSIAEHCREVSEPVFTPSDFSYVNLTQDELDALFM